MIIIRKQHTLLIRILTTLAVSLRSDCVHFVFTLNETMQKKHCEEENF